MVLAYMCRIMLSMMLIMPSLTTIMVILIGTTTMSIIFLITTVIMMRSLKRKNTVKIDDLEISNSKASASWRSAVSASLNSNGHDEAENGIDVLQKYVTFKRFDIVDDFLDHHYCNSVGFRGLQPTHTWTKKIYDEWKILKRNLPDTIYVRVYERRMDLLRAVIIGPAGTPYHDGLFVFDVHFPPKYPDIPPEVHYYSGGLRINPNLYDCGRVCLSLLNTWTGQGNEKWLPNTSTVLQVLVSIQGLILNAKPFFNEPGYSRYYRGKVGAKISKKYNEQTFILSLKTMMYTLRRPPMHFEDFVAGHFHTRGRAILFACRAYIEGADIGSDVKGEIQDCSQLDTSKLRGSKREIAKVMNRLVASFTKNGSKDCEEFRLTFDDEWSWSKLYQKWIKGQ